MDKFGNIKNKINLKDISSSFIIKNIFSFLSTKSKINMIMYNKLLQNILFIDIKDFKKISNKYKIGGKNGKGKEYLLLSMSVYGEKRKEYLGETNILIFEGEYLNGKRNGKGKEYYNNDKLEYEGEYLNGKRNGKGKEYYNIGRIKYEGEYKNGKIWNGKGYNINGNIEFEINNGNI